MREFPPQLAWRARVGAVQAHAVDKALLFVGSPRNKRSRRRASSCGRVICPERLCDCSLVLVERLEVRRRQKDARRVSHEQFERKQAGDPRRVGQRLGGSGSHPLQSASPTRSGASSCALGGSGGTQENSGRVEFM